MLVFDLMNNKKYLKGWIAAGSLLLLTVLLAGCGAGPAVESQTKQNEVKTVAPKADKLQVVTSFYPMYEFTKQVGGDKAEIINLVPPGAEPHDWEPSPQDMARIAKAKVLVYNGAGMETWVEKVVKNSGNSSLILVEASKGLPLLEASHEEDEHGHDDDHGQNSDHGQKNEHDHGDYDPHVWLDPNLAKMQVQNIKEALTQADPVNKDTYETNARQYSDKLDSLDREFKEAFAKVKGKEFVATHKAFTYLAHRYGLKQIAIMGVSPEAEPKPKEMAQIAQEVKEHGIKYVFTESLVSPKVAEAIAREAGAQTLVLNSVEGLTDAELSQGKDYVAIMQENLRNLVKALEE